MKASEQPKPKAHPQRCIHEPICWIHNLLKSPCRVKKCDHRTHSSSAQERIDAAIKKLEERKEYYFSQSCRHDGKPLKDGGAERKENSQLLNAYCERMNGIGEALALLQAGRK